MANMIYRLSAYSLVLFAIAIYTVALVVVVIALVLFFGNKLGSSLGSRSRRSSMADEEEDPYLDIRIEEDLSLAYREFDRIPPQLSNASSIAIVKKIDLTETRIKFLDNLTMFTSLETLVLDRNEMVNLKICPRLPTVKTLWFNNNSLTNLKKFLLEVLDKFPNLEYLSMMRNPIVPDAMDHTTDVEGDNDPNNALLTFNGKEGNGSAATPSRSDTVTSLTGGLMNMNMNINLSPENLMKAWTWENSSSPEKVKEETTKKVVDKLKCYRIAVIQYLPHLRMLDFEAVTAEERMLATEPGYTSEFWEIMAATLPAEAPVTRGKWEWPTNYIPPKDIMSDPKKLELIAHVESELDEDGGDFRNQALHTFWDVNKKTIARYLAAGLWTGKLNNVSVKTAILETIKFRLSYPMPYTNREVLRRGLESGMMIVEGTSKDKRPLVFFSPGRDDKLDYSTNGMCLVYSIERAIQSMSDNVTEYILIVDCSGFGYRNVPPVSAMSDMAQILGNHMAKRLGAVYVINTGYVVSWVYDMVSMFMNDITKKKFRFIKGSKGDIAKQMTEHIDLRMIPEEYGGTRAKSLQETFVVDAYLDDDPFVVAAQSGELRGGLSAKGAGAGPTDGVSDNMKKCFVYS